MALSSAKNLNKIKDTNYPTNINMTLLAYPNHTNSTGENEGHQNFLSSNGNERKHINSLLEEGSSLEKIQAEKAEVQKMLNEMKEMMKEMKAEVKLDVLNDIRWNGLFLGNRWRLAEEGSNSYQALVFRDMLNTYAGNDRRYAMFKNNYKDL